MPADPAKALWSDAACRSLGNRAGRNFYQRLLDHLSKMVFLCFVYRNGLELPVRSGQLFSLLPLHAFLWLLAGGLIYTAGGIIYALRLPLFDARHPMFGLHEIFHLFVMAGSLCHFVFMFCYLA